MRLRELFEDVATKVVAVRPGGFHPFHPGHKSLYDWAVSTFGVQNVYVAATNDTTSRPFPFDIKQKFVFKHGKSQILPNGLIILSSYHPSPRNVNTKIISNKMMVNLFYKAKKLARF